MKTASVMRISDGSSDVCSSDLSTGFAHLDNAGDAVVLGTEASIAWAPFNGLLLSLNGGYSDGNISKPAANSEIRKGSRLPSTPRYTWSVTRDRKSTRLNSSH